MLLANARSDVMFAHCAKGTTSFTQWASLTKSTSLAHKGKHRLAWYSVKSITLTLDAFFFCPPRGCDFAKFLQKPSTKWLGSTRATATNPWHLLCYATPWWGLCPFVSVSFDCATCFWILCLANRNFAKFVFVKALLACCLQAHISKRGARGAKLCTFCNWVVRNKRVFCNFPNHCGYFVAKVCTVSLAICQQAHTTFGARRFEAHFHNFATHGWKYCHKNVL